MTQIVAETLMTASLVGLSLHSGWRVRFRQEPTLHLHYIKSKLKRTPKTTVYLMHPNQTPARLCG